MAKRPFFNSSITDLERLYEERQGDRLARPAEARERKIEGWVDEAGYFDEEMNTEVNADSTYDTALPLAA